MGEPSSSQAGRTALVVGASRGLGRGIAAELVARGWSVIGTVRGTAKTGLHDLSYAHPGRVEIETLDVESADAIGALRDRLAGRVVDMLFVNAGTTTRDEFVTIGAVSTEEFLRVMVTNALGPMRVVEAMADLVPASGLIGLMSSGQGSIANNETGLRDVYRASKTALNMLMRTFAARDGASARAMVLLAPGWIRTDLGGADAPYGLEESIPVLVDVLASQIGRPGLRYVDRFGKTVPW